ncbi:hypothetical protein [Sulfurimonas sp.]|uniref:hypothetical protein n=1 Tax=Sulfurimonas sp. TaxID=2022749 RepID=UPI002B45D035|nr:hypothetical protein [Sulfurimonas sp.]
MKTYIKEVNGLKIVVPHGKCSFVNYNPQEIKVLTKENIDLPICNDVTFVSNGVAKTFKLAEEFNPKKWNRVNPSFMILKHVL